MVIETRTPVNDQASVHILTIMNQERPSIAIIGVGAMGGAMLTGLLEAGWTADQITLVEAHEPRAEQLRATTGCRTVGVASEGLDGQAVVVVAVKPQGIHPTLEHLSGAVTPNQVIVSLVAGVPISVFEQALAGIPIIRTMPNTPALVGEGMTGMAGGTHTSADDLDKARTVLAAVGGVEEVEEHLIDAVTSVSGSGPAYAYLLAEAMVAGGIREGLDPEIALRLASQTIKGAGAMMVASDDDPGVLRQRVTSPGGTTAAALAVMEERGMRDIIADGVAAAAARSRELGAEAGAQ